MNASRVSVVIPTRNRAELVLRAVRSVLAQTRPADEILVIDDGSTDGTAVQVRASFAQVRCAEIPPSGVSAARNHGIRQTSGEWVAFLDSDDEWLPTKLERQLAALTSAPDPLAVCHTDEIWIRNGRRVNPGARHAKRGGAIFQHCLPLCAMSPSSVLIHRRVFARVGDFDENFPACEDYDLWLRITAVFPVLYLAEPLIRKHGGHPDQLSRTVPALDRWRIRALVKILEQGELQAEDQRATLAMLRHKLTIYQRGVLQRGRQDEAAELAALARFWLDGPLQSR